jgi:Na+-driven multidrug efflux pump
MERDSLDFKHMSVGKLFSKQLFPTLLGMISSALFIVADGIFVGRGIGSDALAAVNIAAPAIMLLTGIGLMFGMGGNILASINLSRGKFKVANINITQAAVAVLVFSIIITVVITLFPEKTALLLGANEYLLDKSVEYLFWFSITIPITVFGITLPFFVRQTNPTYAMLVMLAGTTVNIILDYLFIFVFRLGLFGAAIATNIGEAVSAFLLLLYLFRPSAKVHFVRFKISIKSIRLTLRNVRYMVKLGFSTFLSELTIAIMIITGNYVFTYYLGADGVAAYSIVCYLFPIIYMVYNAMIQSAQPIISFNHGCGQIQRSEKAYLLALISSGIFALSIMLSWMLFSESIVSLFIPDTGSNAWEYAVAGLPLFSIDFLFFGINSITIGYYAGIEYSKRATILTLIRGFLPVIFFFILPLWIKIPGIWLAVAGGDFVTTLIIILQAQHDKKYNNGRVTCPDRQTYNTRQRTGNIAPPNRAHTLLSERNSDD